MIGPAEFNDPEAWGYCIYCKYIVAVDDGKMWPHPVSRQHAPEGSCIGGDRPPAKRPPKEVGSLAFTYEPRVKPAT